MKLASRCAFRVVTTVLGLSLEVMLAVATASAQGNGGRSTTVDSARLAPRAVRAVRITGRAPRIDGNLDDPIWKRAFADPRTTASDFVERSPLPGTDPSVGTEAAFAFDSEAVYVAVRAFDPAPKLIVAPYPRRDDETTSDWIFVELDTRHDRRNAFSLGCNPRSVEVDGTFSDDANYDASWNAVWQCSAAIDSLGWTVEYRIPFSQLRAASAVHGDSSVVWGANIYRYSVHLGESANWSPRVPWQAGHIVSLFNELRGIQLPHGQHPFDVRPFVLSRSAPRPSLRAGDSRLEQDFSSSAGADITARIGEGLNLDATVRPDFGQVEADPSQINLTTFETFLPEQRPFFVNGADMFSFNIGLPFLTRDDAFDSDQAFYSRRIGAAPHGILPSSALAVDAPDATDILGAAKITGRLAGGWSVGAMSALTQREDAHYLTSDGISSVQVEPRTAYGALRVQHDFRRGASALGLLVTDVERADMRDGLDSLLARRATFVGLDGRHLIGNYELSGFAAATRVTGNAAAITRVMHGAGHFLQRPDAGYADDDTTATSSAGAAGRLRFGKVGGGKLTWDITGYGVSPHFDADDQGFQHNADWLLALATVRYEVSNGTHLLRRWAISSRQIGAGWSFGGERRAAVADLTFDGDLWNYWGGSFSVDRELSALSLDLLRGGAAVAVPARTTESLSIYSDSRRPTQFTLDMTHYREAGPASSFIDVKPSLTSRITDRLALTGSVESSRSDLGWQYLGTVTTRDGIPQTMLARLHGRTLSLTARADYAFSPQLTLQAYAQPYLGAGRYTEPKYAVTSGDRATIQLLGDRATRLMDGGFDVDFDGDGSSDAVLPNANFNLRELHGSAVLRWEYRPGSELFLVWTQARSGQDGQLDGSLDAMRDARDLFRIPPRNVVLMKLSYRWEP